MLPTPQFYSTASLARHAVTAAVKRHPPGCTVNDILVRVDPDAGEWFGIVSLDTDATDVLVSARKFLPEFRVIGEPLHMESGVRPARLIKKARRSPGFCVVLTCARRQVVSGCPPAEAKSLPTLYQGPTLATLAK